ncbi:hypothetical protein JYU34_017706 [Plutella xylostella]|uniref:Uncharacterized protein n=1 Tax=Plutella xylostella TaxID=51655 RepID=A0ABQ7Q1Y5_PLUXY|nr:hypothetical protein JYU34_017706 [Plutella xylostella]
MEEIKSKERQIIHLQREAARPPPRDDQEEYPWEPAAGAPREGRGFESRLGTIYL